jgi:hypothetical protein
MVSAMFQCRAGRNLTKPNHSLIQTSVGPLTQTARSTYPSVASTHGDPGSGARKDFPSGSKMLQSHPSNETVFVSHASVSLGWL